MRVRSHAENSRFILSRHGMDGVRDQVKKHLLQLDSISLDFQQLCARLDLDLDPVFMQITSFQDKCVPDKFVDVQRGSRSGITKDRANALRRLRPRGGRRRRSV